MSQNLKYKQIPSRALVHPNELLKYTDSLQLSEDTNYKVLICGEAITALQAVYYDAGLFVADSVPCEFIALEAGATGDYIRVIETGEIPFSSLTGDVWNVAGTLSKYVKSDFEQRVGRVINGTLYLKIELGTWNAY